MSKKTVTPNTAVETEVKAEAITEKKAAESKYFISDFVEQSNKFGASKLIVKTALEMSKKTEFTVDEAMGIINKFRNKEA